MSFISDFLKFEHRFIRNYKEDTQMRLIARYKGNTVGNIDYTIIDEDKYTDRFNTIRIKENKKIYIDTVDVDRNYQKQGIGTAMVKELMRQNKVTYDYVDWGMLTDEGNALKQSMDNKYINIGDNHDNN